MTPSWVARSRPLVGVILAVALIVTGIFKANVDHQSGAYATGALVLLTSGACAVTLWSIGALRTQRRTPATMAATAGFSSLP
ncbi:hypothetical protein [Corynebacterium belfantii]|uniref:hypothetical protein n=1 Tax=Corynebacterium belfantii TaxID=2014537 RepID=UPI0009620F58|nr:hypothetical protein [Corynebacterium belfantii]OLN16822.1 hypothetical protein BUE64_01460 [Corynebacterium diphtheriae subsp. lausannense]MBG9244418.1 hypothetical protein [Corynebacterium belfantii]MBG9310286.1 hypothetical protein [Corynebacterium belfantii]MBG9318462.1 hypothetical protein [Corynebacterium belfantii]MBG9328745.1 hypothetical protein [Corynebacterium belfantii]